MDKSNGIIERGHNRPDCLTGTGGRGGVEKNRFQGGSQGWGSKKKDKI